MNGRVKKVTTYLGVYPKALLVKVLGVDENASISTGTCDQEINRVKEVMYSMGILDDVTRQVETIVIVKTSTPKLFELYIDETIKPIVEKIYYCSTIDKKSAEEIVECINFMHNDLYDSEYEVSQHHIILCSDSDSELLESETYDIYAKRDSYPKETIKEESQFFDGVIYKIRFH